MERRIFRFFFNCFYSRFSWEIVRVFFIKFLIIFFDKYFFMFLKLLIRYVDLFLYNDFYKWGGKKLIFKRYIFYLYFLFVVLNLNCFLKVLLDGFRVGIVWNFICVVLSSFFS